MELFTFFRQYQQRRLASLFRTSRLAQQVTVILFIFVFTGLAFAIYYSLKAGFGYINQQPDFGVPVLYYSYEIFSLAVLSLVAGSSLITTLFLLFRAAEDSWLIATPSYIGVLWYRSGQIIFSASWPLLVLLLPLLLAIHTVFGLSYLGFMVGLLALILMTVSVSGATVATVMALAVILTWIVRTFKIKEGVRFNQLVVMVGVVGLFSVLSLYYWVRSERIATLAIDQGITNFGISSVARHFIYLPSHLLADNLYALQTHQMGKAIIALFATLLFFAAVLMVLVWLSDYYLSIWQQLQENSLAPERSKSVKPSWWHIGGGVIKQTANPNTALLSKELILLVRDKKNLFWFVFLALIWFGQISLSRITQVSESDIQQAALSVRLILQSLQFTIMIYFISTFILRFVFPSFSLEARTAWIILSAPVDLAKVLYAKFSFFASIFIIIGVIVNLLNIYLVKSSFAASALSIMAVAVGTFFLVGFGLCLGAIFPNFTTDDPQELTTSLPGLAFIAGALIYGAAGSYFIYLYLLNTSVAPILAFIILSLITVPLFLRYTSRKLSVMEFVRPVESAIA